MTPGETVRLNPKADRDVILYGYLRGTNLKPSTRVHIAGVGDFSIEVRDDVAPYNTCAAARYERTT